MNDQARLQRAYSAYRHAAETVTPTRAVVMLYDGAIRRLAEARSAILDGRIEDRHNHVAKCFLIVNGLHGQLDFQAGGDIAPLLDRYYGYILNRLALLDIRNDPSMCDELIERLREMRASWVAIDDGGALPEGASPTREIQRSATALA